MPSGGDHQGEDQGDENQGGGDWGGGDHSGQLKPIADPVFITFCQSLQQFIFLGLSFDCENVDWSVLKWLHVKSLPHT